MTRIKHSSLHRKSAGRTRSAPVGQMESTRLGHSSQSWYCPDHRCWNSPNTRYCLCERSS